MTTRSVSTVEQKVQWILKNRIHLVGKLCFDKIARAMKHDGLLSKSTYWPDARTGIKEAVRQAKLRWYWEHNGREIRP